MKLTAELRETWYQVALRGCDYLAGMRIARTLAAACQYPPVPKQFIELRQASTAPERQRAVAAPEFRPSQSGRVWSRHCAVMARGIGRETPDGEGHVRITSDSWAACPACRSYARELAMAESEEMF